MGKEKLIESINSDDSELNSTAESEESLKQLSDKRNYLDPPAESGAETLLDSPAPAGSIQPQAHKNVEVEIPLFADDEQPADFPVNPETDLVLTANEAEISEESASPSAVEAIPEENDDSVKAEPDDIVNVDNEGSPPVENIADDDIEADTDVASQADEVNLETETWPEGDHFAVEGRQSQDPPAELSAVGADTDMVADENDAIASMNQAEEPSESDITLNSFAESEPDEVAVENFNDSDDSPDEFPQKEFIKQTGNASVTQKIRAGRPAFFNKIVGLSLLALIVAGIVIYNNPILIGLTKAIQPAAAPEGGNTVTPVMPVPQKDTSPTPSTKMDQCLAKIEEAVRLRNELLEKRREINELDLYYRNGIADLEKQVYQETNKAGIDTYEQALQNKRIELNLRTIQRRRAYIRELAKPIFWTNSGSEELLYLIRKAQLDLQLMDIAGGIDLSKHTRHLNAAVHKYRPSPEKLAIDPPQSNLQPLKKIWRQAKNKKYQPEQISLNTSDEQVKKEICAGNFSRIGELTSISPDTAKCLSKMKGSDLFLNRVTSLSSEAAKQLFQWQGNWICLNGVKKLSPSAAEYLFKWKGNWISLNSLNKFPPELAQYLLKWEGQQLELMGLNVSKNGEDQKTLKYFALWETTGGKLYVPDKIRKDIESLM